MVPEHRLVSDTEGERILRKFGITKEQLPKIKLTDPAIRVLEAMQKAKEGIREGMIVEIKRISKTSEKFTAYRLITR